MLECKRLPLTREPSSAARLRERKNKVYIALFFLSFRHGKAVPPPSSDGGDKS